MAGNANPAGAGKANPPKIGNSAKVVIGGREHNVSSFGAAGTGNVNTQSQIQTAARERAQTQTARYGDTGNVQSGMKSSIESEAARTPRTVEAIKTASDSGSVSSEYKPNVNTPPQGIKTAAQTPRTAAPQQSPQSPATGQRATGNVQTGSGMVRTAESHVQNATEAYYGMGAGTQVGGKSTITSEAARTPRTVEAVKTSMTGKIAQPQGSPGQPTPSAAGVRTTQGAGLKTAAGTGQSPQSPATGQRVTGNVQTGSGMVKTAESHVQNATEAYYGMGAGTQVGGKSTITSEAARTPRTVEAVKTSMTGKIAQPQSTAIPVRTPGQRAEKETAGQAQTGTSYYPAGRLTVNAVTGNMLTTAQRLRAANQTGSGYRAGHLSTTGNKISNAMLLNRLNTMSGMQIGSALQTGGGGIGGAFNRFMEKPIGIKDGMTGAAQTGLSSLRGKTEQAPDIGTASVGEAIALGQTAYVGFRAAQTATEFAPQIAKAGAKAGGVAYEVSNTTAKATLTLAKSTAAIVRGYDPNGKVVIKASRDIFNILHRYSLATGLNKTQISKNIVHAVQPLRTGAYIAKAKIQTGYAITKRAYYDVKTTAGLATVTLAKTTSAIMRGYDRGNRITVRVPRDVFSVLHHNAVMTGLNKTALSKSIIHRVESIKTGVQSAGRKVIGGYTVVKKGINHAAQTGIKTVRLVRGIATGTVSFAIVRRSAVLQIRTAARIVRTRAGREIALRAPTFARVTRGVIKGGGVAIKSVPGNLLKIGKAGRFTIKNLSLTGAGVLTGTDDYMLQGLGNAINYGYMGVKTAAYGTQMAGKAGGYAVRTSVKGGRAVGAGYSFIKNRGLRAAYDTARKNVGRKIVEIGQSAVSAVINFVRAAGTKLIVPLLLIIILFGGFTTLVAVPATGITSVIGSIFSGMFSLFAPDGTSSDISVADYLSDPVIGIPALSPAKKTEFSDSVQDAIDIMNDPLLDTYDLIRIKSDITGADTCLDMSDLDAAINSAFPTDDEFIAMLQPIFNAVILMDYELQPTEDEAKVLMEHMFGELMSLTSADTTEYCGQSITTGEGEVDDPCTSCGHVHAHTDCPNPLTGFHTAMTCTDCDSYYYICGGYRSCGHDHDVTCYDPVTGYLICSHGDHDSSCYSYCNGGAEMDTPCAHSSQYFRCTGYSYCELGHKVHTFTVCMDGVYVLIDEYFQQPIDALSAIPEASRTDDEKQKLQNLKDYYEIFWEMANMLRETYGFSIAGSLTVTDLSGVHFINGTREGCQAVIDRALAQVGQRGGRPFWTYYGFSERVDWCAIFVHWCMRHTAEATSHYPNTTNNAYCQTVADEFFKASGQWGAPGYTDLAAGDCIFFDWERDGHTDHIGLVIGTDGTDVYTAEGNSGDSVRIKVYPLNSTSIYGYGLMNYN